MGVGLCWRGYAWSAGWKVAMGGQTTGGQKVVTGASAPVAAADDAERVLPIYLHPVFFAGVLTLAGLLLGLGGTSYLCGEFRNAPVSLPEFAAKVRMPSPVTVSLDVEDERDPATELLREALIAQGDERLSVLARLRREFPAAPESVLTGDEFRRLSRSSENRQAQERRARQEKAEHDGQAAWVVAQRSAGNPEKLRVLLNDVVARFPNTKAARDAEVSLRKLVRVKPAPEAAVKPKLDKPEAEGAVASPVAVTPKPVNTPVEKVVEKPKVWSYPYTPDDASDRPLRAFVEQYRDALKDWDLETALSKAKSLAASKKYPQLNAFGRACVEDVKDLQAFDRCLRKYFDDNKKKDVQVVLARGSKLFGMFSNISGGNMTLLLNGRFPQTIPYPQGLQAEYLQNLYASVRVKKRDPLVRMTVPLYAFAMNNEAEARVSFLQISGKDNRENIHAELLRLAYGKAK